MFGSYFRVPSVVSGNNGKLLPASVMRAPVQSLGLRDRIRAAKGVRASIDPRAMSSAMGHIVTPSKNHVLSSTLSPVRQVKTLAGAAGGAVKKLKFW